MAKHILNKLSLEEKEQMERDQVQEDLNSVVPDEPTTNNIVEATVAEKEAEDLVTETFENIEIGFEELDNLHLAKKNLEKVNNDNAYPTQQVAAVVMANEAMKYCCKSIGLDHSRYNVSVESLESTANVQLTLEGVGELANKAWEGIKKAAKAVWDFIVKWWNKFLQLIGLKAKDVDQKAEEVKEKAENVKEEVEKSEMEPKEKEAVGQAVTAVALDKPAASKSLLDTILPMIDEIVGNVSDAGEDEMNAQASGADDANAMVKDAAAKGNGLLTKIKRGFTKTGDYLKGAFAGKEELLKRARIDLGPLEQMIKSKQIVVGLDKGVVNYKMITDLAFISTDSAASSFIGMANEQSKLFDIIGKSVDPIINKLETEVNALIDPNKYSDATNASLQFVKVYTKFLNEVVPTESFKGDVQKLLGTKEGIPVFKSMEVGKAEAYIYNIMQSKAGETIDLESDGQRLTQRMKTILALQLTTDRKAAKTIAGMMPKFDQVKKSIEGLSGKIDGLIKKMEHGTSKGGYNAIGTKAFIEMSKSYSKIFAAYSKGAYALTETLGGFLAVQEAILEATSIIARHRNGKKEFQYGGDGRRAKEAEAKAKATTAEA